jgi:hypothetical protein
MNHHRLLLLICLLIKPADLLFAQVLVRPSTRLTVTRSVSDSIGDGPSSPSAISRKHTPRQATVRSALLPGLGQLYNHQPWKLGLVYGGAGAAFYFFRSNQSLYVRYLAGYQTAYLSTTAGTKTATVDGYVLSIQQLKRASDQYRQQRDLTLILTAVGWVLNAVEANVAAHLMSFDLSDDLSLRVAPSLLPTGVTGFVPGLRLTTNTRR